jgi:hypothetical protein
VVEDLAVFLTDFGVDGVLNGSAVRAIVDTETVGLSGVASQQPSALVKTSATAGVDPGDAFAAAGVTYLVRELVQEPPDGAFTRAYLARS